MAVRACQLDEADRCTCRVQGVRDQFRFGSRIEPIGVETDDGEARLAVLERSCQPPAEFLGQVEIVDGAGDIEVGIGIEPVSEADPLMAQIAFDLKIGIEAEGLGVTFLQAPPEFFGEAGFGQIGDVRRHPRHREARRR